MDGEIGSLNIRFTANDSGVQETINNIINTINGMQSQIDKAINQPMIKLAKSQAIANEQIKRAQSTTAKVVEKNSLAIQDAQNKVSTNAKINAEKYAQAQQKTQQSIVKTQQSQALLSNYMKKGTASISSGFNSLLSGMGKLAKFMVFSYFGRQIVDLGSQIFLLGSDMAETENLFQVSFREMSGEADAFAQRLNEAWGVDVTPIKEQTAYLNQMFKSMQFGTNTSYTMSTELEKLSYNMSSLYNISQEDAFEKLRSGIAG